jgi:predicted 3-demethylubiquinone-9 3-methyltransferase (glyoxalase superfamily)
MKNKFFPCLWQNGTGKQAAELYSAAFGDTVVTEYNGMVVMLDISGCKIMLLNAGPMFTPNPSISLFATFGDEKDVDTAATGTDGCRISLAYHGN